MLNPRINRIQLIYCNDFSSIWEYASAVEADSIALGAVLGDLCPACGCACGFREIEPYTRGVIELFPLYRRGRALVARFLCRAGVGSFSLLPHQLVPYHQYTAESMVWAVWFVSALAQEGTKAPWHRALAQGTGRSAS